MEPTIWWLSTIIEAIKLKTITSQNIIEELKSIFHDMASQKQLSVNTVDSTFLIFLLTWFHHTAFITSPAARITHKAMDKQNVLFKF